MRELVSRDLQGPELITVWTKNSQATSFFSEICLISLAGLASGKPEPVETLGQRSSQSGTELSICSVSFKVFCAQSMLRWEISLVYQLASFPSSFLRSSVNEQYLQETLGTSEVRMWFSGLHLRFQSNFLPVLTTTASVSQTLFWVNLSLCRVHPEHSGFPYILPDVQNFQTEQSSAFCQVLNTQRPGCARLGTQHPFRQLSWPTVAGLETPRVTSWEALVATESTSSL